MNSNTKLKCGLDEAVWKIFSPQTALNLRNDVYKLLRTEFHHNLLRPKQFTVIRMLTTYLKPGRPTTASTAHQSNQGSMWSTAAKENPQKLVNINPVSFKIKKTGSKIYEETIQRQDVNHNRHAVKMP